MFRGMWTRCQCILYTLGACTPFCSIKKGLHNPPLPFWGGGLGVQDRFRVCILNFQILMQGEDKGTHKKKMQQKHRKSVLKSGTVSIPVFLCLRYHWYSWPCKKIRIAPRSHDSQGAIEFWLKIWYQWYQWYQRHRKLHCICYFVLLGSNLLEKRIIVCESIHIKT